MSRPFQTLERVAHVAPFGVRFRDSLTGEIVSDGLVVEAYPQEAAARRRRVEDEVFGVRRAFANRSGTFVLMGVPGLREFEQGAGDDAFWNAFESASPPTGAQRKSYVIEVRDVRGRFLPFTFEAELPVRGLFKWDDNPLALADASPVSPPAVGATAEGLPLFSAPARDVPAGMAVIRTELLDVTDMDAPRAAAYALVEARFKGKLLGRGISDERGRVALIFPYPEPAKMPNTSSPVSSPPFISGSIPPLMKQEWQIDLYAGYAPTRAASPPASPPTPATAKYPDLLTTLKQTNAPARLWRDTARTEELTAVTLQFGRQLTVRTYDHLNPTGSPPQPAPQSVLFITPAASPP